MPLVLHPGTHPDKPDRRDVRFASSMRAVPSRIDLSGFCGAVYTQRRVFSCSAHAIATALRLVANRDGERMRKPSRLFMYYNARVLAGEQGSDAGATMRNAIKAVARQGACPETEWPYLVESVLRRPPRRCYQHSDVRSIAYRRIARKLDDMHACLAEGNPFVFAINAYPVPFTQAANSGFLRVPRPGEKPMGGHALIAVGYDKRKRAILARNSLGPSFADDGFFWVADEYFTNPKLTYDFWQIAKVDATR